MSRERAHRFTSRTCVAIATAIAVLTIVALGWLRSQNSDFEAMAIVGPVELEVNPVRVARVVSALDRGPRPERDDGIEVSVRPVSDSRLTLVSARGDDPRDVALAANERAAALVDRLNDVGAGLGVFTVASQAAPPPDRSQPPGARTAGLMGLVALVCLIVAIRGLDVRSVT